MTSNLKCYILQIIEHTDIGKIRDVKVTGSKTEAEKWNNKKIKTNRYSHGYTEVYV